MNSDNGRSVPLREKFLYGVGYFSVALTTNMIMFWLLKRYRPDPADERWNQLLTEGVWFVAINFGRIVDAIADPLVGYYSDNIQTRWGRRKPFILIGAPLLAITFVLIWTPPVSTISLVNGIYLALVGALFFFAFTIVVCPYLAMLPEITADSGERVRLTSWQAGFNVLGAVGGVWIGGHLIGAYDYRTMALVFAPVVLVCSWVPLLVRTPAQGTRPAQMPLRDAIVSTLKNPLFPSYVISQLLFWTALSIVISVLPKLVEIRADVGASGQGAVAGIALVAAAFFFPVMPWLARRIGKRSILLASMVYFGILMGPLAMVGGLPIPLSGFGQAMLVMSLAGPAVAALFTLPNAMVADIVDHDSLSTGHRREAIYFGVQGLLVKGGVGLGMGLAGVLAGWFGETAARQGGFTACAIAAMILAWVAAGVLTQYRGD